MNELHLREPIYYGDRSTMYVGIAHFRLVDDYGSPKKGNIRIWIDLKVKDKNGIDPEAMVLAYKYPFTIACSKALEYPKQTLNDYHRTVLHIIPMDHLKVQKTRRKRTMPQSEFKKLTETAKQAKADIVKLKE